VPVAPTPGAPLAALRRQLQAFADPTRAAGSSRFFKTGPGEYGEGDRFMGITVPQLRSLVAGTDPLGEPAVLSLLHSTWHEERLLALFILVRRFERSKRDETHQQHLVSLYLANTRWINSWDLVDCSAPLILGAWLLQRDRAVLDRLVASPNLWEQRIAVLATLAFIREDDLTDTLRLCRTLLTHPHDLLHKACGWMLREAGKRDVSALRAFLDAHAPQMPRTMLRYALEKLSEPERRHYLSMKG
jgi:3-methyladenine DNA glycosylase AlkD